MWYIVTIAVLVVLNLFQIFIVIRCVKKMQVLQNQIILLEKTMMLEADSGEDCLP